MGGSCVLHLVLLAHSLIAAGIVRQQTTMTVEFHMKRNELGDLSDGIGPRPMHRCIECLAAIFMHLCMALAHMHRCSGCLAATSVHVSAWHVGPGRGASHARQPPPFTRAWHQSPCTGASDGIPCYEVLCQSIIFQTIGYYCTICAHWLMSRLAE